MFDFQVTAKWAFRGKLEDVSAIIDSMRAKFVPCALSTTFLFNNTKHTRALFAIPTKQQTMRIQCWKDMVAEAGFDESDIRSSTTPPSSSSRSSWAALS